MSKKRLPANSYINSPEKTTDDFDDYDNQKEQSVKKALEKRDRKKKRSTKHGGI